jgi:hypothetical protein
MILIDNGQLTMDNYQSIGDRFIHSVTKQKPLELSLYLHQRHYD